VTNTQLLVDNTTSIEVAPDRATARVASATEAPSTTAGYDYLGIIYRPEYAEPQILERVQECCFSILALESESVDPRP
jgi:hypothetical protein